MRTILFILIGLAIQVSARAQNKVTALFVGNSYTYQNNLPQLIANIATSKGDTLVFDGNNIGGYTFEQHSTNATTLAKIAAQPWDYVILQEQSQRPAFPPGQVAWQVYPFADTLVRKVRENDPCSQPMFYMTWGRKNGDAGNCGGYPPLCTYLGMQQRLYESYLEMGQTHQAPVAPVGAVWRTVRDSFPAIELYVADESHPSLLGSYLAACTFYASLFHQSPVGAAYPVGIVAADAANIQRIAQNVVFDSLAVWQIDTTTVAAGYTFVADSGLVAFDNVSANADTYWWDFGDGNTSTDVAPQHQYAAEGSYTVSLVASHNCKLTDTSAQSIMITFPTDTTDTVGTYIVSLVNQPLQIMPNPARGSIKLRNISLEDTWISIYNASGQRVLHTKLSSNVLNIEVLPSGLYFIEASQLNGAIVRNRLMVY